MQNKRVVLGILFFLLFAFLGLFSVYSSSQSATLSQYKNSKEAPFVRAHATVFGGNKKGVRIVEFMDPQCEACALFHPLSQRVFYEYEKEVQWVIRYLDNHANSKYVIKILQAAQLQNRYNEVLDMIFDTQPLWSVQGQFKPQILWAHLENISGLNHQKLRQNFDTINIDDMLAQDRKDANALGVRGTPTLFVNGKKLEKLTYQNLLDLVEEHIYK